MPYTVPTAGDLKTRHPAFASLADSYIEAVITDAARFVDTTWTEDDYQPAIMYLTAHLLINEGALDGSVKGVLASEAMGDASVSYDNNSKAVNSDYGSTSYGRRFWQLLQVNKRGALTTAST